VLELGGRIREALDCYKKVTELQPGSQAAWLMRGVLLGRLEAYEEAMPCFE